MARIHHVKSARQRYRMVPVLDDAGQQVTVPVMKKRWDRPADGPATFELVPALTKRGAPIVKRLSVADKDQPLPGPKCEVCGTEVKAGQPYKWVQPKTGPYGGRKRVRCVSCPIWQQWDLSNSLSARVAQIQSEYALEGEHDAEAYRERASEAAEAIRELAQEREESAQNMEDGFGHEVEASANLWQEADDLNSWADDLDGVTIEDEPLEEDYDLEDDDGPEGTFETAFDEWQAGADAAYDEVLSASPF